jgi:bifunctional non-homologous end joining protein LigD
MLLGSGPPLPGGEWVTEGKHDGMRSLLETGSGPHGPSWHAWSRHNTPIRAWFPELSAVAEALGGHRAVLDGEIVAFDRHGHLSFTALQRRIGHAPRTAPNEPVAFIAFDLLWLDGEELIDRPWHERRARLEDFAGHGLVLSPVFDDRDAALAATRRLGQEGVVHKRRDARYTPGRRMRSSWTKEKHTQTAQLVVGGVATTARCRDALLVGDRRPDGRLAYRGCVELALPAARRPLLAQTLRRTTTAVCPFTHPPRFAGAQWVEPALVVEVRHTLGRPGSLREPLLIGAVGIDTPAAPGH